MEQPHSSFLVSLGVSEDEENGNDEKTQAGEGRNDEERGQSEPAWAATAAEEKGEKLDVSNVGQVAPAATDPVDNRDYEEAHNNRDDQENVEPQELIPEGTEGTEGTEDVLPVSMRVRGRRRFRQRFTQWQLQELERIFRRKSYINGEARKQLARWMGVTEAKVQRWFIKRREQCDTYQRL